MQWLRILNSSIADGPENVQGRIYKMMGFSEQDLKKVGMAMGKKFKASYIYEYVSPAPFLLSPNSSNISQKLRNECCIGIKETLANRHIEWNSRDEVCQGVSLTR